MKASDLQSNLSVSSTGITGTLNNIDNAAYWDVGTWPTEEATGHYVFLKATGIPEGAVATVEVVNGTHGPTTLDSDLNIILRIANKDTQQVKLTVTLDGESVTKTYSLTGLTLAE